MRKVLSVSYSDLAGGAAKAAYRLHCALNRTTTTSSSNQTTKSQMLVMEKVTNDWTVVRNPNKGHRNLSLLRKHLAIMMAKKLLKIQSSTLPSISLLPSNMDTVLNQWHADLVHLHWIGYEMLSISNIGKIKKPLVWTLHDMWPFCGAEHYSISDMRWRDGYTKENRPTSERGIDLNRLVWKEKLKKWKVPINIVTPSNWLADCVRKSFLMKDWPVRVIHNPIDTDVYKPIDKKTARDLLGFPRDKHILLFGSAYGASDPRKGFSYLKEALDILQNKKALPKLEIVVLGSSEPKKPFDLGFPVRYMSYLYDDISLNILYSSADITVIPSTIDNLPNMAVETLASGTPVVAFSAGGLPDLIKHEKTGYLAKPFNAKDMADGIELILKNQEYHRELSKNAREYAVKIFSYDNIAKQYINLYEDILLS